MKKITAILVFAASLASAKDFVVKAVEFPIEKTDALVKGGFRVAGHMAKHTAHGLKHFVAK